MGAIMQSVLKKWMLWLTVAAAAGMLFLRLVAAPRGWLPAAGGLEPGTWASLFGCIIMVVNFILCRCCRAPAAPVDRRQLASVSTVSILCGAALLICTLFDVGIWIADGRTPAPNEVIISGIDGLLLILMFVFGALGGVFLVMLGFSWLTRNVSQHGQMRLMALAPMVWAWMRLARYVVSYSSAVDVKKNLGEFLMLIFTILFFFSFARYVAAVGKAGRKTPMLLFYACGAFLFSSTSAVTRLAGYWIEGVVSETAQMAGAADMAVGLLALAVAIGVAYTRRTDTVFDIAYPIQADTPEGGEAPAGEESPQAPSQQPVPSSGDGQPAPQPDADTVSGNTSSTGSMDVEDILQEIYKDKP